MSKKDRKRKKRKKSKGKGSLGQAPEVTWVAWPQSNGVSSAPPSMIVTTPYIQVYADTPQRPPCLFDGLPPGTYGLACHCPRCAVWC